MKKTCSNYLSAGTSVRIKPKDKGCPSKPPLDSDPNLIDWDIALDTFPQVVACTLPYAVVITQLSNLRMQVSSKSEPPSYDTRAVES